MAGDLIRVGPGAYAISDSLAKNGVNWDFALGAIVTLALDTAITGIWDDGGADMTFSVAGDADFIRLTSAVASSAGSRLIHVGGANSDIAIACRDLVHISESDEDLRTIDQITGKLGVNFRHLRTVADNGSPYAVWWENGPCYLRGVTMRSGGAVIYPICNTAPTGDLYVEAEEIVSERGAGVAGNGSNVDAACWIVAKVIRGVSNNQSGSVLLGGSNKVYVHAQKLFGPVNTSNGGGGTGGLFYVTADKVSAVTDGTDGDSSLLNLSLPNTTSRIAIKHYDAAGFAGSMFNVSVGTATLLGGEYVGSNGSGGLEISGGTVRAQNMRVDTSANPAGNPVAKTGGTLILDGCALVANATRDSITSPTAQTVKIYATTVANKAKSSNVTIQVGSLIVDANVS